VKYLYCPKCKELRVKPWYSIRDRCSRCLGDVKVIDVPRGPLTFVVYALAAVAIVLAYLYTRLDEDLYIYVAVAFTVAMGIVQFKELVRGERYARAKIRVTRSDLPAMRKKGWR
jgi:uncharacterized protein (DUF983 family)